MENVSIKKLTEHSITQPLVDHINGLLKELTKRARPITLEDLAKIAAQDHVTVFLASIGDQVVGMTVAVVAQVPLRKILFIEDTIVSEAYRGQGIGKMLTMRNLALAEDLGVHEIDLSSNPSRTTAIALYQSLGFVKRDTNFYRLTLRS